MYKSQTDFSIADLIAQDIPELVGYNSDIVMLSDFGNLRLFSHPARLKATTVLICLDGEIDCSINLKRFTITANQILVNFANDIIRIHSVSDNFSGYAVMVSEDYLHQLQIDFRLRVQSYIGLRDNGPMEVPYEELHELKPYYTLLRKNINDGNLDVIKGLTHALAYTILAMVHRAQGGEHKKPEKDTTRAGQLFDRFMTLLQTYHDSERSIQFYADKMCLTPKYVSMMIKTYSGKCAIEWINEYVILEAKMMLRYTPMTIQEISNSLNFATQSAFGKYFKQQVGMAPKQYRSEALCNI